MNGPTELRTCPRCKAWERAPMGGELETGCGRSAPAQTPQAVRWSDGFLGWERPRAVRCPSCAAVHLPVHLSSGPGAISCALFLAVSVAAGLAAASATRKPGLGPVLFVGGFMFGVMGMTLVLGLIEGLRSTAQGLLARWRRVVTARPATPDEIMDGLRADLAPTGDDELRLRLAAWRGWNHHDRATPALTQDEARKRVEAVARAAGRRGLEVAPAALALVASSRSHAEHLRLDEHLTEAVARAGARLEVEHLPVALREPQAPPARPAWWEDNLRRMIDLMGATSAPERFAKVEVARALGDRALALRLLSGDTREAGQELRGWYELLVESDDRRVAQVPAALLRDDHEEVLESGCTVAHHDLD